MMVIFIFMIEIKKYIFEKLEKKEQKAVENEAKSN